MDGRRLRWCLYGGLVASAVGCHRNNTYPEAPLLPKPGAQAGVAANAGAGKSFWGGSKPPQVASVAAMPGDPPAGPPQPKKKGPPGPDTEVHFARVHVDLAFNDPPPPNRDEHLDTARKLYQHALKQDPKNQGALLGIAQMHAKLGERDRATEAYRKYLEVYPNDAKVCHDVAMLHAQWKDWPGATAWCEAALRLDPENRTFRKTMGFCLAWAGKWDEAFTTLCGVMPEAQARHNLAGLLDHMGQTEACRQQLRLAAQADPNYAPAREFLAELDQPAAGEPGSPVPATDPNPVRQAGYAAQP